jgi:AcrR family transcriptional regulator
MKAETVEKATRGRPSRRPQIVAATEKLVRTRGLASVTTRAIAEEAGCSEAALYVHFQGRLHLLLAVLEESLPDMLEPLRTLEASAGRSTPRANVLRALRAVFAFHERVIPTICGLFADPELLAAYRKSLTDRGKGPAGAISRLRSYIRAEQELGRLDAQIDAEVVADTLMASSFFHAFTGQFLGKPEPFARFSHRLLDSLIPGEDGRSRDSSKR